MILHWPQFTWLALTLVGVGIGLQQHGEPKTGTCNGWTSVVGFVLVFFLLYAGGFFSGGCR